MIGLPEIVVVVCVIALLLGLRGVRGVTQRDASELQLRARLIAACVVFALISLPLILKVVPPNGIYGFRTAATQSSRAIWYPANAFMGWALMIASGISATLLLALPSTVNRWLLWVAFIVPVGGAVAASVAYVGRLVGR